MLMINTNYMPRSVVVIHTENLKNDASGLDTQQVQGIITLATSRLIALPANH